MATVTDQRTNGPTRAAPDALRVDPSSRHARRPRTSWVALGSLVLVAFGLFGAMTVARVAAREPVLALAQPLSRGDELTAAHLRVVRVGTDDQVQLVPASEDDQLLGLTATANLGEGTLITRDQFASGPTLARGESVVGLALAPGEYPTANLRPGDLVIVVNTPAPNDTARDDAGEPNVLANRATVFAVEPLSETARTLMVSVAVQEDVAASIAAAASEGRVRLVLVGGS